MLKILLITILSLCLFSGGYGLEFKIKKFLKNAKDLEQKLWPSVIVNENCSSADNVTVRIEIPVSLCPTYPDIKIFFANDNKEILQICLNDTVQGSFFFLPYHMEKTMTGSEVHQNITKDYLTIKAEFSKFWLPKNCSKISASIQNVDGTIYNYYGIKNFDISIPDVMVVEEYFDYKCNSTEER